MSPAVGLLCPEIVAQLRTENAVSPSPVWLFSSSDANSDARGWVSFSQSINTPAARSQVMKELCERWRDTGLWRDGVGPHKWRGELYPVYRNPFAPRDYPLHDGEAEAEADGLNYAFKMERVASGLFGIYMAVYEEVRGPDGQIADYSIWIPRCAATKQTWPG
ncbi:hypothetical protein V8D89_007000 [Ganoderma adspersum]